MDVLSDVLHHTRGGPAVTAVAAMAAPWALEFDEEAGVGFHVVLAGTAWLTPQGGEPVHLSTGDVALVLAGAHHLGDDPATAGRPLDAAAELAAHADDASQTRMLCGAYVFERSGANPLLGALPPLLHLDDAAIDSEPGLRSTIQQLAQETSRDRPGLQSVVDRLVDLVLIYAIRAWTSNRCDTTRDWLGALDDIETAHVLDAMHERPGDRWTVADLAQVAGLSRAAFAKRFADQVGIPPMTYLTSWRMRLAAERLRTSDISIASLADEVGYDNEFSFSRAFKREHDLAPAHYRSRQARSAESQVA